MKKHCQSCGMPFKNESQIVYESNGEKSKYCIMCYSNGEFLQPNITVNEMKIFCVDMLCKELKLPKFIAKFIIRDIHKLDRWR
ncbi:zinc ribbon domain-containing protein [Mycoplasmatota bacterium WC44]